MTQNINNSVITLQKGHHLRNIWFNNNPSIPVLNVDSDTMSLAVSRIIDNIISYTNIYI